MRLPEIPLQIPPKILKKSESRILGVFFWYFRGIFSIPCCRGNCWSRRYAEWIWGEFFILVRRILGKLPANFSANFDSEFFGLVFPGFQATPKIHAQNSRPELSAFLFNFTFSNPKFIHGDFLLTGETKNCMSGWYFWPILGFVGFSAL